MASASTLYYCHRCEARISPVTEDVICPHCNDGFVEKLENEHHDLDPDSMEGSTEEVETNDNPLLGFPFFRILAGNQPNGGGTNVFSFDLSNNRTRPSASGNEPASSSSAPYHLRPRANRSSSSSSTSGLDDAEQQHIHDVLQRAFSGFEPGFFQFSFGGGSGAPRLPFMNFLELHGNTGDYAWGPNGLDNIISQLLGQLENAGPPPASKQVICSLPTVTIAQEDVDVGRDCSVCMDPFKLDDKAKKLPCSHFFHIKCIDPWLELHNTCPICRKVVEDPSCGTQGSSSSSNNLGAPSTSLSSSTPQDQSVSSDSNSLFGQRNENGSNP